MTPSEMEKELERLKAELMRLDEQKRQLERQLAEARAMDELVPPTSGVELERTLRRMFMRFARYLQAERCLFMLRKPTENVLAACPPGIGFEPGQLKEIEFSPNEGVIWDTFNERRPYILNELHKHKQDALDVRKLSALGVQNLLAVPLVWERRDEDQRVVERKPIGVLAVMNKRRGEGFSEEDRRILEILSRQSAQVIVAAQLYIEIRERKEQLERAFESLVAAVIMVTISGKVGLINHPAQQAFCYPNSDGVGRPYQEVIAHPKVREIIETSLHRMEELTDEVEISKPEERIYRAQTALVRDEQGQILGIIAILSDVTEIRGLERLKTQFVATVSHELRTPLTSIKGFISTLLEDREGYFDHETRYEFYQIIDQECDRLKRMIDDLLNLSRIERGVVLQPNWQKVDIRKVVDHVISAQQLYTDKHRFVVEIPEPTMIIVADEDMMERILTNIVNNAIKYSPNGGAVTVRVSKEDGTILFSVTDEGIGIPKDKLDKVFERFSRVDTRETRQAGGTGLGLYLVKHLVEVHEGSIWVESEVGAGSTFFFRLPVYPQKARDEGYDFRDA